MTFEEFERLPDEPNKLELIDGELFRMPPAKARHGKISQVLNRLLEDIVKELHDKGLAHDLGVLPQGRAAHQKADATLRSLYRAAYWAAQMVRHNH